MTNPYEIAYIAGMIDGEGSIGTRKCKKVLVGSTQVIRSPFVQIAQKKPDVLRFIQAQYGGTIRRNVRANCHELEFKRHAQIAMLLEDTLPFLRVKHEQAIMALIICAYIKKNMDSGMRWKGKLGRSPYLGRIAELADAISDMQAYRKAQ